MKTSNGKNIFKLIFINILVAISLLIFLEISAVIGRFLINKKFVGFLYKIVRIDEGVKSNPCERFLSHPILGHIHNPSNGCEITDAKIIGNSVLYDKGAENKDAILILGASNSDGFIYKSSGKSWQGELAKILKSHDLKYSVLNASTGLYNSYKQVLKLTEKKLQIIR